MGPRSFSHEEGLPYLLSLETHGDELVTIEGLTLPINAWLAFCPIPHDQMDPVKVSEIIQKLLEGKNPFSQKEKNI